MKKYFSKMHTSYLVSIILIVLIISVVCTSIFMQDVQADETDELVVEDLSNENQITFRYSNIQGFLNASQPQTRSSSAISKIDLLYDTLNISKEDLSGIDESDLLTAESITVSDTLMIANEDGSLTTRAAYAPYEKDFPDIVNDNGNNGYMSGRIVVVQNSDYDKVYKNKEGEITKFLAYGFECSFNMRWLKLPVYTMKDYFTFCASNGAFTETDSDLVFSADAYFYDANYPSNSYSYETNPEVSKYYSSGWPVFTFNLPSHVSSPSSSITYSNYRLSARARVYALEDFNIVMSYAHKQLVTGDLSVSISASGPSASISFGGTSHREYQTPNFFIDTIKDPAMEALKE